MGASHAPENARTATRTHMGEWPSSPAPHGAVAQASGTTESGRYYRRDGMSQKGWAAAHLDVVPR